MSVIYVIDESGEEQEHYSGEDYDTWETEQVYQDLALDTASDAPDDLSGPGE